MNVNACNAHTHTHTQLCQSSSADRPNFTMTTITVANRND